jgi:hypothetical protein
MLLGIVARGDVWKYGIGGALLGALLLVWAKLQRLT